MGDYERLFRAFSTRTERAVSTAPTLSNRTKHGSQTTCKLSQRQKANLAREESERKAQLVAKQEAVRRERCTESAKNELKRLQANGELKKLDKLQKARLNAMLKGNRPVESEATRKAREREQLERLREAEEQMALQERYS